MGIAPALWDTSRTSGTPDDALGELRLVGAQVAADERRDGDRQAHHREEDDHVQVEGDAARGQLERPDPADDHHEHRERRDLDRILQPGRHPEADEPRTSQGSSRQPASVP